MGCDRNSSLLIQFVVVQQKLNVRFGKCLLELNGNDAITVMGDSNI